jgi:transcription initiation factor IIE alpha subunit
MTEKTIRFHTEIVNGICPTCEEYTMLVGLTRKYFRCITCGADLEQFVNGKISYIPRLEKTTLQSVVDGYFSDGQKES